MSDSDLSGVQPSVSVQTMPRVPDSARFNHAAMLIGRSLYWDDSPQENVARLGTLVDWRLKLPGVKLGIALSDVATLVGDVYASSGEAPSPEVLLALSRFGVDLRAAVAWPTDVQLWHGRLPTLIEWLRQAASVNDFVWIDAKDAD